MIFVLILGIMAGLITIYWGVNSGTISMVFTGSFFIFGSFIAYFFIFPMMLTGLTHDYSYNIPPCPAAGIKQYERQMGFTDNETNLIHSFQISGYINITTYYKSSGGWLGGHDEFVRGDCLI